MREQCENRQREAAARTLSRLRRVFVGERPKKYLNSRGEVLRAAAAHCYVHWSKSGLTNWVMVDHCEHRQMSAYDRLPHGELR